MRSHPGEVEVLEMAEAVVKVHDVTVKPQPEWDIRMSFTGSTPDHSLITGEIRWAN